MNKDARLYCLKLNSLNGHILQSQHVDTHSTQCGPEIIKSMNVNPSVLYTPQSRAVPAVLF